MQRSLPIRTPIVSRKTYNGGMKESPSSTKYSSTTTTTTTSIMATLDFLNEKLALRVVIALGVLLVVSVPPQRLSAV